VDSAGPIGHRASPRLYPKCFGFVQTYDRKPKRRLFEVLRSQGMQMNQQVMFLTEGGEDVRDLPLYMNPQAEQYLDWFHVTMRLTVMGQMAKGLHSRDTPKLAAEVIEELDRLKWLLWHGNVFRALQTVQDLEFGLDVENANQEQRKLLKTITEFGGYIRANASSIPNYGSAIGLASRSPARSSRRPSTRGRPFVPVSTPRVQVNEYTPSVSQGDTPAHGALPGGLNR